MATSTKQLIVVVPFVHRAFRGVFNFFWFFSLCLAVALLFEKHLHTYFWQLFPHLPNDLTLLTTLFGLSPSKQHLGLSGFPFLCLFAGHTGLTFINLCPFSFQSQCIMTDSMMSKAATMEIPINSNGDTGTLPEDDSLEQVGHVPCVD